MNGNVLFNDFFMEIKKNLPRFLSILLIVALGVAFFSGVRATKPDMQYTAEVLYDKGDLMDLRIVSSLGLTSSDLAAVQQIEGVESAEGIYTADVQYDDGESKQVIHLISSNQFMNQISLTEGRLPERTGECMVDRKLADSFGIKVGDMVIVESGTGDDISETLSENRFIAVGIGDSPLYIWRDRGTSMVGNGSVSGFLIVEPEVFKAGAYSEIDVKVAGAKELLSFSDRYQKKVDEVKSRIEEIQEEHARARYGEVSEQAQTEVVQAETELNAAKQELTDAKSRLDTAEAELNAAKAEVEQRLQEMLSGQTTIEEQEKTLMESASKLEAAKVALDTTSADLLNRQSVLTAGMEQLEASRAQLRQSWDQWSQQSQQVQDQHAQLASDEEELNGKRSELEEKQQQLAQLQQEIQAQSADLPAALSAEESGGQGQTQTTPDTGEITDTEQPVETPQVPDEIRSLEEEIAALETEIAQKESENETLRSNLEQADAQLNTTWTELDNLGQQLEAQGESLNSVQAELTAAMAQLTLGQAEYEQQLATLNMGQAALATAKQTLASGQTSINSSQTQIAGAESELAKGKTEYEKNYTESRQKLKDATEELNDKKRQLMKMEVPEWNLLDRSYIQSYESFAQDADRVGAIGNVFPLILFLVAALVSLTSVTRMVEEQRTQIGTLKALGYEKYEIAAKYICYALLASLIGGILGAILGQMILPRVIMRAYRILYYTLPASRTPLHLGYSLSSILIGVLCTTGAGFGACYKELMEVPAQLMRPEAPKNGKRVFLEKWSWLWSKLNFSRKAAVRNMIRYKKRFFMTIFGIAASTALLLVGFGLKNSVSEISRGQFGRLQRYNSEIILSNTDVAAMDELEETLDSDSDVKSYMRIYRSAVQAGKKDKEETVYLTVPEDYTNLNKYMSLKKRGSKKAFHIQEDGVIISEKLAKLLHVKAGDSIYLMDDENYRTEVKITAVTENYFRHYVYMSPAQYEELYGGAPSYNEIFTINSKTTEKFEQQRGEKYLALDAVGTIVFNSNTEQTINDMLKNMDMIILILIVSAALLSFVVLYNLNHINITERRRELATMKVLGFHNGELTMYVLRENILLTVIGVLIGVVLGIFLHRFVIATAELDMIMFGRVIHPLSYLFSILLTFVFAAGVNGIMHRNMKKIDMVESLKSVE